MPGPVELPTVGGRRLAPSIIAMESRDRSVNRTAWLLVGAVSLAVLFASGELSPSASGHGTHTQLGLPPCGFRQLLAIPCPACGLTTSFAHMARLQVAEAFRAHPLGVLLFALAVLAPPLSLLGFVFALSVRETFTRLRMDGLLLAVALLLAGTWAARIAAYPW